jgi:hypothetical protein
MIARHQLFFQRHPLLRDACIWAIPALCFGALLRLLLLSYLPYAYWGSDSRSYYSFAELFLDSGKISLYDKRRYLYPIFLLPVSILPGSPLKWVAWIQHALGLLTLIPLAYSIRKVFTGWRLFIIPVTLVYAGMPILIWYEHELLAEGLFFHSVAWMIAGWLAFSQPGRAPNLAHWWWFFGAFAVLVLTKPAGRFFWPAFLFALVCLGAWRLLRRKHWISIAALFGLTFTIGQDTQASWLLYTSALPLTRLDTPSHSEFKAEIRDIVEPARHELDSTLRGPNSRRWEHFLKFPEDQIERPAWQALGRDPDRKSKVYNDLAIEGIGSHPFLFLKLALGKILASANPDDFKSERFLPAYYVEKYAVQYEKDLPKRSDRIRRLFALPADSPVPAYPDLARRIAPHPDSSAALWLHGYVDRYQRAGSFVISDGVGDLTLEFTRLTWWFLGCCVLALLPWHFKSLGIPLIMAASYLFGTFLVGGVNPRYFGAVWGVVLLLLCIPLELILRGALSLARRCSRA